MFILSLYGNDLCLTFKGHFTNFTHTDKFTSQLLHYLACENSVVDDVLCGSKSFVKAEKNNPNDVIVMSLEFGLHISNRKPALQTECVEAEGRVY